MQEHYHIDGEIGQLSVSLYIIIREYIGFLNPVFWNRHHIVQCRVLFIIFSALYLNGKHPPCVLDYKIKLALFLAVVIVQRVAVGVKLLRHHIFVYSAFVDIFFLADDLQLAGFSVYGCEQSYI